MQLETKQNFISSTMNRKVSLCSKLFKPFFPESLKAKIEKSCPEWFLLMADSIHDFKTPLIFFSFLPFSYKNILFNSIFFVKHFLLHCYLYGLKCFATHIRMKTISFVLEQCTVDTVLHQLNFSNRG